MHDRLQTGGLATALIALVMLAGCQSVSDWVQGRKTAEPVEPVFAGDAESTGYLGELYALANGDPVTQAEIFTEAESAATLTPATATRLRFALVLAAAGHAGSDPARAQGMLRDLLAEPELMTAPELALATVFLKDVEARMILDAETRRLRNEHARATNSEETATSRRIAQIEAENRQLKESLAEAEAKLEAITSIERSIREQSGETDPP